LVAAFCVRSALTFSCTYSVTDVRISMPDELLVNVDMPGVSG
jgi:hypothetical protein